MLQLDDDDPRFNHDGVHDIHRAIRRVFNDYPHAVAIGEVWVFDNEEFAKYLRPDELHLGFNFRLVRAEFDAADIRDAIDQLAWRPPRSRARRPPGRCPTTTSSARSPVTAAARSALARARAMALVMLALAGCGVRVQRPGARAAERRAARRGAPGPGLGSVRRHASAAGTACGCRCRGRATSRRSGSLTPPTRGCRFRRSGRG